MARIFRTNRKQKPLYLEPLRLHGDKWIDSVVRTKIVHFLIFAQFNFVLFLSLCLLFPLKIVIFFVLAGIGGRFWLQVLHLPALPWRQLLPHALSVLAGWPCEGG